MSHGPTLAQEFVISRGGSSIRGVTVGQETTAHILTVPVGGVITVTSPDLSSLGTNEDDYFMVSAEADTYSRYSPPNPAPLLYANQECQEDCSEAGCGDNLFIHCSRHLGPGPKTFSFNSIKPVGSNGRFYGFVMYKIDWTCANGANCGGTVYFRVRAINSYTRLLWRPRLIPAIKQTIISPRRRSSPGYIRVNLRRRVPGRYLGPLISRSRILSYPKTTGTTTNPPTLSTTPTPPTVNGGGQITGIVTSVSPSYVTPVYTAPPAISITGGGGSGAVAVVNLNPNGTVNSVTITNAGSGYTQPPVATVTGGGGSGGTAVVNVDPGGTITGLTVINPGSGYTTTPTVSITGGGGSGVTATVNVNAGGTIDGFTVTDPGSSYVQGPVAIIDPPEEFSFVAPTESLNGAGQMLNVDGSISPSQALDSNLSRFYNSGRKYQLFQPEGFLPNLSRRKKNKIKELQQNATMRLAGAPLINVGLFFPFVTPPVELIMTTFIYNPSTSLLTRAQKDVGTNWLVADWADFETATEGELLEYMKTFNILDEDFSTAGGAQTITVVGWVTYLGQLQTEGGDNYCIVYCNKSLPSTITAIANLHSNYWALIAVNNIKARIICKK